VNVVAFAFVVGVVVGWNAHARTIGRRLLRAARRLDR
jgi:hypothetical protein